MAAENGGLPRGKVGGVGDVIRDLPRALALAGWRVSVLTPSYGMLADTPGAMRVGNINVDFAGKKHSVEVVDIPGSMPTTKSVVFEHPLFSPLGPGQIYCAREDEGPFATDAGKFAFFAAVTAAWVDQLDDIPDVVHLHDWHAAFYCLLRSFSPAHVALQQPRTVFTIHNIAYQGTRPLDGDDSSLANWFPGLEYDVDLVADPRVSGCINPMALAIRTADRISTVSPSYVSEILRPSDSTRGFVGGEGLEGLLGEAADAERLCGILNGCEYAKPQSRRPGWQRIVSLAKLQVSQWLQQDKGNPYHELAGRRLAALPKRRPRFVLVSISRLVRQKVSLFLESLDDGRSALEHILDGLGPEGIFIMLGNGESQCERAIGDIAARNRQLVFLCGYAESLSDPLYSSGDLFLMPSSFEPCGISQMLAMRAGQPVVAHAVGGLRDTVEDGVTGFLFAGETPGRQAEKFAATVARALTLKANEPEAWQNLRREAATRRFDWASCARETIAELYD